MPQYWVVGAMYDGTNDQLPTFIRRGYWILGWGDSDAPGQVKRRDQIKVDDRIAVKRMMGRGSPQVRVMALGIVKDVGDDGCIYVNWVLTDIDRVVESHGWYSSIHGPFQLTDDGISEVFSL